MTFLRQGKVSHHTALYWSIGLLLIAIGIVVVKALYYPGSYKSDEVIVQPTGAATTTLPERSQQPVQANQPFEFDAATIANQQAACVADLQKTTTENNTEYAKGSILVSFKGDFSFAQAQALLARYELKIQTEEQSEESFKANNILTVLVPKGYEFSAICILRGDSEVKYAGLNVLFSLHQ